MIDETQVAQAGAMNEVPDGSITVVPQASDPRFPPDPFPCPNCAQMLGPDVRVCVACRQPIDPSKIKAAIAAAATAEQRPPQFVPRARSEVRFPWLIFVVFLILGSVMTSEGMAAVGFVRGVAVFLSIQVVSSAWVYVDARRKGIPKPFYWSIGSLFFWLPIFSWYLVRRRQPQAACSPIEAGPLQFLRTLALIFGITIFLTALFSLLLEQQGRNPIQKSRPSPTSNHGGSIATRGFDSLFGSRSAEPVPASAIRMARHRWSPPLCDSNLTSTRESQSRISSRPT